MNIKCDENIIELNANSDSTKLKINIPVEQLDEYAIAEEQEVSVAFSLTHLCKMCTSIKLSGKINVSVSKDYPMLLVYNLGDDSKVSFFIAPKVSD